MLRASSSTIRTRPRALTTVGRGTAKEGSRIVICYARRRAIRQEPRIFMWNAIEMVNLPPSAVVNHHRAERHVDAAAAIEKGQFDDARGGGDRAALALHQIDRRPH